MTFDPKPITLAGQAVRLEPLSLPHAPDLFQAASHASIWTYMPLPGFLDIAALEQWIQKSIEGPDIVFAIVLQETGRAIGSTRYMDIRREHRGLEIGWTWLTPATQRTRANTEAKYLLLKHAFEDLGAWRVQLKTDGRNLRSQAAIERIGAIREGVLRRHMQTWSGHVRDTVYFSVLDHEWPVVKTRLKAKL